MIPDPHMKYTQLFFPAKTRHKGQYSYLATAERLAGQAIKNKYANSFRMWFPRLLNVNGL